MQRVEGQSIYLTRGDTAEFAFTATNDDGTDYEFQNGDQVFFRMALKAGDDVAVQKECIVDVENNKAVLILEPEDTQDCKFKVYRYEVELIAIEDGGHYTFITDQSFEIGKEIEAHE